MSGSLGEGKGKTQRPGDFTGGDGCLWHNRGERALGCVLARTRRTRRGDRVAGLRGQRAGRTVKVGAGYDGTRARSAYKSGEDMSEADMKKGRSPDRERRPQRAENTAGLMEACLLVPHCGQRHRPSACGKFKDLSLQHRQSVIAAKELCVRCLRHSDLDESKKKECIRRGTTPHW